jgi:hypothetical protein
MGAKTRILFSNYEQNLRNCLQLSITTNLFRNTAKNIINKNWT